jgi:hypothetical protein
MKEDANMRTTFALLFAVMGGFNTYFAITSFMEGSIGFGVFSAIASLWCLSCMIINLKEEN